MLSCTSSNKLTKGKSQRVSQNLNNQKIQGSLFRVEHWATYPTKYDLFNRQDKYVYFRTLVTLLHSSVTIYFKNALENCVFIYLIANYFANQ